MIVAFFPIASGAADMALLMISSSVIFPEGILCCWATANPETRTTEHPNVSAICRMDHLLQLRKRDVMSPLAALRKRYISLANGRKGAYIGSGTNIDYRWAMGKPEIAFDNSSLRWL